MNPSLYEKIKLFFASHRLALGFVVVVMGIAGFLYHTASPKQPSNNSGRFLVATTTITQEVHITGSVKAASVVNLSFEKSGIVAAVYQREGAFVSPGQPIVVLSNADLAADVAAAQADLEGQQASLAQVLRGPRDEDIRVKETSLSSAQQTLANYYTSIRDILESAYATTDDATRAKLSALYIAKDTSYQLAFTSCSGQEAIDAVWERYLINKELATWRTEIDALESASSTDLLATQTLDLSVGHIDMARKLLATTNDILTAPCAITNATLDADRTNVNLARTELNASASALSTLKQNILSQKLSVEKAQRDLELTRAPATPDTIATAQAHVAAAQARLDAANAEFAKSEIRSPIAGIVTKVSAEPGELMTPGAVVVTVMSRNKFEIEAYVPEADIAKLSVGNTADVTLDTYGDNVHFSARIYFIDPAETIVSNVPTYRVKLQFTTNDNRIKSGMTANITLITAQKEGVRAIPTRAVILHGSQQFVRLINADQSITERPITTGLRGSKGMIEVLSGLSLGDTISLTDPSGT